MDTRPGDPTGPRKRATMADVAREAGVSRQLVSLVVRDVGYVSEQKRAQVLEAADRLGYRRNALAAGLAAHSTRVIGMPVYDLHNQVYAQLGDGVTEILSAHGYQLLLTTGVHDLAALRRNVDALVGLRPDGMILATHGHSEQLAAHVADVPTVTIGEPLDLEGSDSVQGDDVAGAALATEHLLSLGVRDIVFIGGPDGRQGKARREGYEQTMRAASARPRSVPGDATLEGGRDAFAALLVNGAPPKAVICYNDPTALGVMESARDHGLTVPEDVAVVGYDGSPPAGYSGVDLTTVDQRAAELGAMAARLLLERIEGGRTEARHEVITPTLTARRSTLGLQPGS